MQFVYIISVLTGFGLASVSIADDGTLMVCFQRDRPVLYRVQATINRQPDGREVRVETLEVMRDGHVALSHASVFRWASGFYGIEKARDDAETRLVRLLVTIKSAELLNLDELKKLMLAGRGDIARCLGECESIYLEHQDRLLSWDEVQSLSPACDALRAQFREELFGPGSLLRKHLASMLSPEELKCMDDHIAVTPPPESQVEQLVNLLGSL